MADTVYNVEEVKLQDGTEVQLRPAVIKVLRKGNEIMERLPETKTEDEAFDVLVEASVVCLEKQVEGFSVDRAEEVLDLDTIYKILDVCLGVKLNNPKLLEAAAAMAATEKTRE